jgi:hypothetical protein
MRMRLQDKGVNSTSNLVLCDSNDEDNLHLFLSAQLVVVYGVCAALVQLSTTLLIMSKMSLISCISFCMFYQTKRHHFSLVHCGVFGGKEIIGYGMR